MKVVFLLTFWEGSGEPFGCLLVAFWVPFGCLGDVFGRLWVNFGSLGGRSAKVVPPCPTMSCHIPPYSPQVIENGSQRACSTEAPLGNKSQIGGAK